jgi:SAM-dependent methyltransferase
MEKIHKILSSQKWIVAKSMPNIPHEYSLRRNYSNDEDFVYAAQYIRDNGVTERFWRKNYIYLNLNGYKYWTMGCPLHNCHKTGTILINRARYEIDTVMYDNIAEAYTDYFSAEKFQHENKKLFAMLNPHIKGRVLDIGCGSGLFLDYCTSQDEYTGIDASRSMVEIFKNRHPKARVINDYFENTYTGRYDTIVSLYGAASYLSPKAAAFLYEHLNEGGAYILMQYKQGVIPETYRHFGIEYDETKFNKLCLADADRHEYNDYIILTNGRKMLLEK